MISPEPKELTTDQINKFDGIVLDVRTNSEYGAGHVPNSVNIGLGGQFATWAGTLVPIGTAIAVAAENQEQVNEAVMRLARVGHENVTGFILIDAYKDTKNKVEQVSVEEVSELTKTEKHIQFVDVRNVGEHNAGHAARTLNIPLGKLSTDFERLDPTAPTYVICQGGYRSSIGTSILENAGFKTIYNVTGGTAAWIKAGLETEASEAACATK